MSIFRAYDIRGVYKKDLTDEIAEKIGKAFVNLLHAEKAVIGMDVRTSSPELKEAVIKGMTSQGCDIIDIGLVPIPLFYFFIVKYKLKAGMYITGSHDPLGYNGLKPCSSKSIDLTYESGIAELEKTYNSYYPEKTKGKISKRDISSEYKKQIKEKFKIKKPLHVVIDAGNGCWSELAPKIFKEMGFKVTKLFCEFDGMFPNRPPEPNENNLEKLKNKVKEVKADLGIAYDVDGDRATFIDEKGRFIHPDFILMIFARKILNKGDKLVADIRCTKVFENEAGKFKWKLIWNRVGRSYIKQAMMKNRAVLGGEYTGHYYFKRNSYYDDGLFASLMLAEIIDKEEKPVSHLLKDLVRYPSIDFRMRCNDEKKFKVINELKTMFKGHKLVLIDGVGIKFKNGFALIRASNTEPKIELRCEAKTKYELNKIKNGMERKLKLAEKRV